MNSSAQKPLTLFWFSNDLRLDDNPALAFAASAASALLCCYCHDPTLNEPGMFGTRRLGALRSHFLRQSLHQLSKNLQLGGQRLVEYAGSPVVTLQHVAQRLGIKRLVRSRQFGQYEMQQWQALKLALPDVELIEIDGNTLFDLEQISALGPIAETFSRFRRKAERLPVISPCIAQALVEPIPTTDPAMNAATAEYANGPGFCGGEHAAAVQVDHYFSSAHPANYKQTRNALEGWNSSSKMSPWLASGCLSVRRLFRRIKLFEAENGSNESTYWLFFELLWREYFQWYALHHREHLFLTGGITGKTQQLQFDQTTFKCWCDGETPWPLVNACMKQLNQTGYLSNRARQIVASALIYELGLDWRSGAAYFEQQLIDYDVASNWGNWQYIAGVGADPRGGRQFNIEKQTQQYDPKGNFVAKWAGPNANDAHHPLAIPGQ
jgi:deoxyribodipyrimidine photo-lyase